MRLELPIPLGFRITTTACRAYLESGLEPTTLAQQIDEQLLVLQDAIERSLRDHTCPILVSVRSGARFSMPGMMETVLDIGLTHQSVLGMAN
jgi:pyruvate,orthophosphate dikinase